MSTTCTSDHLKRVRAGYQLTKIYRQLEEQMLSRENSETVKELYEKLKELFETFKKSHMDCLDNYHSADEIESYEQSYCACKENFNEFQERYIQWTTDEVSPEERCSVVTSASSSSSTSRVQLARAKLKKLKARNTLKQLTERQAIKCAKIELENKRLFLEQQSEIEDAEIEEQVWREVVDEENASVNVDMTKQAANTQSHSANSGSTGNDEFTKITSGVPCVDTERLFSRAMKEPGEDPVRRSRQAEGLGRTSDHEQNDFRLAYNFPHTATFTTREADGACRSSGRARRDFRSGTEVPVAATESVVTNIDMTFQRLASALHDGFSLPKPELFNFSGKPIDYSKFVENFDTNIESRVLDDRLRLSYLIQYCEGEAKLCIEDCVLLDHSEGYKRARSILHSRYGRPNLIASSYIDKLVQFSHPILMPCYNYH
ncbi:uncharacterized protein LOC127843992 [Dreissena polymorpha]|uniref:uncharacterized protein LOC127843992 n=1 Tax=Dreissena polymorpha TaxID=45954 RepID=UPI002264F1AC|nr:uncharacterized protein LOC127843992 [Dreissena polymorpha]XP_052229904.1 uncharacterized protein LOC127843992 [Dreissena polymorpha]